MAANWEYDETVSAPVQISIRYTVTDSNGNAIANTAYFTNTQYTQTWTAFRSIPFINSEGKEDEQEVVIERSTLSRNTVAAVNGGYVKWRLENGKGLPTGDANHTSITAYTYVVDSNGPKLRKEVATEYFSEAELAGSLAITEYATDLETGAYFEPSTSISVVSSQTETIYDEWVDDKTGRSHTQTKTTRFQAMGLTQEGQQSAAEQLKTAAGTPRTVEIVDAMKTVTCDGTEIRSSIGRIPIPSRPNEQSRQADELLNPTDPNISNTGRGAVYDTASVATAASNTVASEPDQNDWYTSVGPGSQGQVVIMTSDGDTFTTNTTAEYTMPFAPDDYIANNVVVKGKSQKAARKYGLLMNRLKAGNAFGDNITTVASRLPSEPFAPIYLNAAGISAGMRLNGTSWAFDQNGLVCSSDLLLCGVAGRVEPVTSSWVRSPVPATSLPILTP